MVSATANDHRKKQADNPFARTALKKQQTQTGKPGTAAPFHLLHTRRDHSTAVAEVKGSIERWFKSVVSR